MILHIHKGYNAINKESVANHAHDLNKAKALYSRGELCNLTVEQSL